MRGRTESSVEVEGECRPRRAFGTGLLCERFHFLKKFARCAVGATLALMQSHEWLETIPKRLFGF